MTISTAHKEPGSARFRVYREILDLIRSDEIAPGSRMPNERKLAEMQRASRTQVRDALLMLQKEGLVERKMGSGTYLSERAPRLIEMGDAEVNLATGQPHNFQETLEVRLLIEPALAAKAAGEGDPVFLNRLSAAADKMLETADWLEFKESIYAFSRLLYEQSRNDFLLWTFEQILRARRNSNFDGKQGQVPVSELVRRHVHNQLGNIADALASGDPQQAEEAVRNYLVGLAASSAA